MSCNKQNCHKRNNLPREELLDIGSIAAAIAQLLQVAKTGADNFVWTSAELAQLAQMIVALVRRPEPSPPLDVVANDTELTLHFGPQNNAYVLHVPAGNNNQRSALILQLVEAAARLGAVPSKPNCSLRPNQLPLPFLE